MSRLWIDDKRRRAANPYTSDTELKYVGSSRLEEIM